MNKPLLYPFPRVHDTHELHKYNSFYSSIDASLRQLLEKNLEQFWNDILIHLDQVEHYFTSLFTQQELLKESIETRPILELSFLLFIRLSNPILLKSHNTIDFEEFEQEESLVLDINNEVSDEQKELKMSLYWNNIISLPNLIDFTELYYNENQQLVATVLYKYSIQYPDLIQDMLKILKQQDYILQESISTITLFCKACPYLLFSATLASLNLNENRDTILSLFKRLLTHDSEYQKLANILWKTIFLIPLKSQILNDVDIDAFACSLLPTVTQEQRSLIENTLYQVAAFLIENISIESVTSFIHANNIESFIKSLKVKSSNSEMNPILEYLISGFADINIDKHVDSTVIQSMADHIQDLFPDMKHKDIISILSICNNNVELAIQWILEHPEEKKSKGLFNPIALSKQSHIADSIPNSRKVHQHWTRILDDKSSIKQYHDRMLDVNIDSPEDDEYSTSDLEQEIHHDAITPSLPLPESQTCEDDKQGPTSASTRGARHGNRYDRYKGHNRKYKSTRKLMKSIGEC